MTREIGRELELPKTCLCQLWPSRFEVSRSYSHGHQEVGGALLKPAYFGYKQSGEVGYECLYDKDDRNDCEVGKLVGGQLRSKLGKDWVTTVSGCIVGASGSWHTEAWGKQLCVEVRQELLVLCVELAHSRDNVARQTDTDNLHHGLEDEQRKVRKVRVRAVLLPENLHEAACIASIVERLCAHGDEVVSVELRITQT